ncbi:MAG: hypothetical protein M3Y74_07480 [Chloroflexota bacterium]|nr:hypothetical protein [Chloroflexota bacterium]
MSRVAGHGLWPALAHSDTDAGALLLAATGGVSVQASGRSHTSGTSVGGYQYQLHITFFSREAHQPRVIDPQMFVAAPGVPAGVGPQMIRHGAGVLPVLVTEMRQIAESALVDRRLRGYS